MSDDRGQPRTTFDSCADLYQRARPEYPGVLYDALTAAAQLRAGDRLLEIGCATGKATLPLAGATEPFDLVFAATAWHWLDPVIRYRRVWELLRPGGHLAFWSATHVFPHGGDPFFAELHEVYEEVGEALPEGAAYPRPGELPDERKEIERSGLFDKVVVVHFDWEVVYDAEGYIRLLNTFSDHIAMKPWQRDRLYAEIRRRLMKRADGCLRRGWGAVLHVARRRDAPTVP